ncbi:MAG: alpha/beta hydrolase [Acetobacteraceae bacterium]|nr:alpha/beta hydrolase [Acetobacteraceae bacterium]
MPSHGIEMHHAASGPEGGPPLVMVHGTLGDQRSFAAQMEPLAAAGFRVLALSLRHCWPDSWRDGGDFRIDTHVADVAAFIRALGRGPVALLGHSRGGHIAFRVAEHHPELLSAVILAEPGGERDPSLGGAPGSNAQASAFAAAAALIAAGDEEGGLRAVAEHTGGPGAWERRPEERKAINRANARTLLGQIHEARRPYTRAAAEGIRVPTLLLLGAQTRPAFTANVEALGAAIPGARTVVIPRATHGLMHENPADVNAAILAFLGEARKAAAE